MFIFLFLLVILLQVQKIIVGEVVFLIIILDVFYCYVGVGYQTSSTMCNSFLMDPVIVSFLSDFISASGALGWTLAHFDFLSPPVYLWVV